MAAARVLHVTVLRVEHGLFCNVCLLPAGARIWVSFNEAGVGQFVRCTCCGSDDVDC